MKRLFGTDGIRAVAGTAPLDPPSVRRFGLVLAQVLEEVKGRPCRVVLGRDTRESGPWLRDAVAAGLFAGGAEAVDAGVITTPGLAGVVRADGFDSGVMISASHNPFGDNGLKVFDDNGVKLTDDLERQVEKRILDEGSDDPGENGVELPMRPELLTSYLGFLEQVIPTRDRFRGVKVALDCANGAASHIAPEAFKHYGAEIVAVGDGPNGRNINLGCGSMHLETVAHATTEGGCQLGIAFDGDADRALAVDRRGRCVDGDHMLFILGRRLHREGRLRGGAVVATIMSNLWLEKRLGETGISLHRTAVGDKYVLERMSEEDLVLGGEQSGHIIFREHATTGDGILTGLLLLDTLLAEERTLDEILDDITPFPQVLINVRVKDKPDLREHPTIGPAVRGVELALADAGRVVLRYSGTEPLARVMVEGSDAETVRGHAEGLVRLIREELGV
jgi:phosphoglucosamine mutase